MQVLIDYHILFLDTSTYDNIVKAIEVCDLFVVGSCLKINMNKCVPISWIDKNRHDLG